MLAKETTMYISGMGAILVYTVINEIKKHDDGVKASTGSFIAYEPMKRLSTHANSIPLNDTPLVPPIDVFLRWCDDIFLSGFETIFGLLAGRHGCPFMYALLAHWQTKG
jgi:hypothetical protein